MYICITTVGTPVGSPDHVRAGKRVWTPNILYGVLRQIAQTTNALNFLVISDDSSLALGTQNLSRQYRISIYT